MAYKGSNEPIFLLLKSRVQYIAEKFNTFYIVLKKVLQVALKSVFSFGKLKNFKTLLQR